MPGKAVFSRLGYYPRACILCIMWCVSVSVCLCMHGCDERGAGAEEMGRRGGEIGGAYVPVAPILIAPIPAGATHDHESSHAIVLVHLPMAKCKILSLIDCCCIWVFFLGAGISTSTTMISSLGQCRPCSQCHNQEAMLTWTCGLPPPFADACSPALLIAMPNPIL